MELSLINSVSIVFTPGSGGNFLRHFLDPTIKEKNACYFVDRAWFRTGKKEPYVGDRFTITHVDPKPAEFTIGLGPTNLQEYIRVRVMINTKNMARSIEQIDNIIEDFHSNTVEYFTSECDYMLSYTKLFDWNSVEYLYKKINAETPPDYKKEYFNSYKIKHNMVYSSWQYKVIEKIYEFEYNNTLKRNWSIDDITKNNWQQFLQENLCLTNYH